MDISLLEAQLKQEAPEVYQAQKDLLSSLLDEAHPQASQVLIHVLETFQDNTLLSLAMSALAKIRSTAAINAIARMLEHPDFENRHHAARALGYSRSEDALLPLKALLIAGLQSEEGYPVKEALWALANLCQSEVFKADAEWENLITQWRERGGEYSIMARHIFICWEGQVVIS